MTQATQAAGGSQDVTRYNVCQCLPVNDVVRVETVNVCLVNLDDILFFLRSHQLPFGYGVYEGNIFLSRIDAQTDFDSNLDLHL